MLFGYFTLFVALLIETVGAYYSITGLAAIFSGAVIPILIMGGSLELGKVTAAVWLKNNWERAGITYKLYLLPAVAMLMLITSMGIFGYLSKAHNDQTLVSGDVGAKLAVYDEKIKTARDNIESARKQLSQMDAAVDQVMSRSNDEKGADKSNAIRNSQKRDRASLAKDIEANQKIISQVNDEAAPIRAENRKVEAEVGPIKYIAKLIYEDNPDANILEKAVTWVIMIIVAVFDPLALVLILAAQQSIRWAQDEDNKDDQEEETVESWFDRARLRARFWDQKSKPDETKFDVSDIEDIEPVVDQHTHIAPEDYYRAMGLFDTKQALTDPYISDSYTKNATDPSPPGWMFTAHPHPASVAESETIEPEPSGPTVIALNPDYVEVNGKRMHYKTFDSTSNDAHHAVEQHLQTQSGIDQYDLGIKADNAINNIPGIMRGFGTSFPVTPSKGDMFLRVDQLPSALYKFNGNIWIEVDKALTDQHAYDEAYIDHLINKISTGEYDPELLSDAERENIEQRLNNNTKQG